MIELIIGSQAHGGDNDLMGFSRKKYIVVTILVQSMRSLTLAAIGMTWWGVTKTL
jgi:hypothetical protein